MFPSIKPGGPNAAQEPHGSHRPTRPSDAWLPAQQVAGRESPRQPSVLGDLKTVVVIFLIWRGLLFGLDYVGRCMTTPIATVHWYEKSPFWDGYVRMDSLWFASIIKGGYRFETEGPWKGISRNSAFFPLYPYMVKALVKVRF